MKQHLVEYLSVIVMISFFTPVLIVLVRRLWRDPFFLPFSLYWAFSGIVQVIDFIPGIPLSTQQTIGAIYNMIDIPFVMFVLYYTTTSLPVKKFAGAALVFYLSLEVICIIKIGVNYDALKYALGTGLGLVIIMAGWEIVRYMQQMEHHNRQNAKVLIYAAVLFEYASFIVVYIVDYFTTDAFHEMVKKDIYLVYYISTLIGIIIACCGYLIYQKFIQEEPIKNEIKINII